MSTKNSSDTEYFHSALIECSNEDYAFYTTAYAWGSHLGEAVERIRRFALANGLPEPNIVHIDPVDPDTLPETAQTKHDGLSYLVAGRTYFTPEYRYRLPRGIVFSGMEGEFDQNDIRPGYQVYKDDEGLITIEAVVEKENLLDLYLKLLPESGIPVFWVALADDWEDAGKEEFYTNDTFNDRKRIAEYLENNRIDTLENGHVILTTYVREGQTNININDHKLIVVMTFDEGISNSACKVLEETGLERHEQLINVSDRFYHWHYRHPEGADRKGLIEKLLGQGFTFWKAGED